MISLLTILDSFYISNVELTHVPHMSSVFHQLQNHGPKTVFRMVHLLANI